jgi:plasmid stabilization system protein ParE
MGRRKGEAIGAIRSRFELLLRAPEAGPPRRDVGAEYRSLLVGRHLIFYRLEEDAIFIVRILPQRMDAKAHFQSGDPEPQ